jgi:hypothetical protein
VKRAWLNLIFVQAFLLNMILRSFAANQPYVLVSLPIAVGAAILPAIWMQPVVPLVIHTPLQAELSGWTAIPVLSSTLAVVVILAGSWLANAVFNKSEFYNTPAFVVAMLYALFGSIFALFQINFAVYIASLLVLIGLERQLCIFKQPRVLSLCFESGFWYGLAALLYPPFLSLIVGAWIALLFNRAFHLKEHLLLLIAAALPFLYWAVYLYCWNRLDEFVLFRITASFNAPATWRLWPWSLWYFTGVAVVGLIISLPRYLAPADRAGNRTKMVKNTFLIMALAQVGSMIVAYSVFREWIFSTLLVTLSILLGYWFTNYRYSLMAPFVYYALLLLAGMVVTAHYF